ncbi:N-alpha-acetyltransferase 38, NatC auxiliary subunit isoform X1 [Phyllopteryx taeniolatus]|uniref:N-alpha-acetyltransferase 38, NatC auxiliary subunit isoform X1 n=1 Tax=Phycodurus eques TaxID=693459 RepID=UPI002ACECFD1|nr:N-alpha-acetyltransferase 38, NatC auxiliary subunit isoform X1 [Phycodurus eques]XP_061619021.1 N-alpha-acetyltransferase 38, NatC auxiliary subunit isoform X1 [Phyllopteryx taeniolatus]
MATIEENGPPTHDQRDASSSFQAREKLQGLLNKNMRIRMTDGRTLVGLFLCTDRDCNIILGSAQEFLKSTDTFSQGEPRVLGLAMIPGHHVVSIEAEADTLDDAQDFGVNHSEMDL